jgi:endonuclease/exonuclease/phosphatase family metal-dependent hydrolase
LLRQTEAVTRATVLAWNVGHRAGIYPAIPAEMIAALGSLEADVVLLNEYYDDGRQDRRRFREQLAAIGYAHCDQSLAERRHNCIFVASRLPFTIGDIPPPQGPTSHATTNFLHVRLDNSDIELIGLRRPDYKGAEKIQYWAEVTDILRSSGDRALVIAGDINEKLFKKTPRDVTAVPFPGAEMYSVPRPDGDWSYTNPSGTGQSQIDHVLHTSRLRINQVRYRYEVDGIALAAPGPLKKVSLSDHAALTFTAELT